MVKNYTALLCPICGKESDKRSNSLDLIKCAMSKGWQSAPEYKGFICFQCYWKSDSGKVAWKAAIQNED